MANFEKIVQISFNWEGGYSAYSNDTASWCDNKLIGTNRGISAIAYKGYYGYCPSVAQLKALTEDQAKAIYKKLFWDKLQLDYVKNDSVAQMMFQYIIGSGASQISDLKAIANDTAGHELFKENDTPFTIDQAKDINGLNQKRYFENLQQWRLDFFDRLVASNPSLKMYLQGWRNRTLSYHYEGSIGIDKLLMISTGVTILIFFALMRSKKLTIGQKVALALSAGVITYTGVKIYDKVKNNNFKQAA